MFTTSAMMIGLANCPLQAVSLCFLVYFVVVCQFITSGSEKL